MNGVNKSFEFYRANKESFRELYDGKYIVIKGEKVIGVYEDHTEAHKKSMQANGNCIIEHPVKKVTG